MDFKICNKLCENFKNLIIFDKKICLVISNYPVKNGRIGNGVGLNTPSSIINILNWLKEEGYEPWIF